MKISPLPSSFGDDHLCAYFVKLFPEFFSLKVHFRVVLYVVILWRRGSRREGSERKSWKESWVAIGGIETVGRSQTCNETPVSKEEEDARLMWPGKGRLQGGDEGCSRPPRPKSGRGRKGGENAMVLTLGAHGDIIHSTRHW